MNSCYYHYYYPLCYSLSPPAVPELVVFKAFVKLENSNLTPEQETTDLLYLSCGVDKRSERLSSFPVVLNFTSIPRDPGYDAFYPHFEHNYSFTVISFPS